MTANRTLAIRVGGKFKRASAPKSRGGCLTCKFRHLKCDEAKPFCQRCADDKMKCDGYAPPKPRASKKKKSKSQAIAALPTPPMEHIDQMPLLSDHERVHFQHFVHWTAKQISASSAASNFWLCYALPMSYQFDAIRYSMIAVGASHRAFMSHSLGFGRPDELQRPVIQHYNRAISSILPLMSSPTRFNMHCILICCMLFMACEGLTGRYDELLKHFSAGDTLLQSLQDSAAPEEASLMEKLVAMFSQLCPESSDFMKDPTLSGIKQWCVKDVKHTADDITPFKTLDEASYALHQFRFLHDHAPHNPDRENGKENDEAFEYLFKQWGTRFQALAQRDILQWTTEEMSYFQNIRLRQRFIQMHIDSYSNQPQPCQAFLETAELVAAPLIEINQPTYALDGCLVSGLSFAAFSGEGDDARDRALGLLRKLDHREGIYDSNDVAEMHALCAMDLGHVSCPDSDSDDGSDDESEYGQPDPPLKSPVGIPNMIEMLSRQAGVTSKRLACYY
ncbi:uncharacterized protein B0J16DRAFT_178298 [Fusarium flagelliforme]|uniref:uncharacterized protein n=1 Tax=Fusarium flagelliforme TaxID=2675880 RepID=UPI001E8CCEF6|nr:uncharacterized protein B0J16DRAFT_178298 [Fusarium flagelliforme]KAH7179882.1 hypothetical protein B0J16DRAFT_178298 [Fusarium flagelliforme]